MQRLFAQNNFIKLSIHKNILYQVKHHKLIWQLYYVEYTRPDLTEDLMGACRQHTLLVQVCQVEGH